MYTHLYQDYQGYIKESSINMKPVFILTEVKQQSEFSLLVRNSLVMHLFFTTTYNFFSIYWSKNRLEQETCTNEIICWERIVGTSDIALF